METIVKLVYNNRISVYIIFVSLLKIWIKPIKSKVKSSRNMYIIRKFHKVLIMML